MKRHHAAELPPPASGDLQAEAVQEETDKLGKFDKEQRRCSRLCYLLVLSATVSMLARHCYDSGLVGATGDVVRIETVSNPSSPSLSNIRKINPIARGKSSFSEPSTSLPDAGDKKPLPGSGDKALSDPSASVSADTGDKKPLLGSGNKALSDPSASVSAETGGKTSSDSSTTEAGNGGKPLSKPSPSAPDGVQGGGHSFARALEAADEKGDPCGGRYIYVQELPSRFNTDMVRNCETLSPWTDMCKYCANGGFGTQLSSGEGVFQEIGWYNSDKYTLDIIFHDRIKRYECLTDDSSLAAAVFVPFYAGLDVARHLWGYNVSTRDAMALEMVDLVTARPEWRAMGGRDHFFVAGRTTWDFRRQADGDGEWGNKIFRLPAVQNMTALVVEASPWHLNDAAVPFPTAFHPASDEAVFLWQDRVRGLERQWLFSFTGAPRAGSTKSIGNELIEQCKASSACSLMACGNGPSKCYSPASYMKLFQNSTFCLLPQGDSYTRKSAFDAMLAGCIPVFFHPGTAYVQYTWHLPKNYTDYSVYIPEDDVRKNVSVEERLRQIPPDVVKKMRDAVVGLIPTVIYSDPSSKLESTVKDAFDVTVDAVIDKVTKLRKGIVEGRMEDEKLEMYSWKYPLLGEGQKTEDPHEWDPLFAFN